MTTGLPFDDFRALLETLPAPDETVSAQVRRRNEMLNAQGAALGRLGDIAEWLAAWTGRPPQIVRPMVALFAGTHEVARRKISLRDLSDVQAMVEHCAAGGAAVNQICATNEFGLKVFDLALDMPAADITRDAALDERGCAATMAFGMEAIAGGADLVCLGSIGVGGETVAAAIMRALHGGTAADWVGEGSDALLSRRRDVVEAAVDLHSSHLGDPLEVLRRLGGREFAAIAGAILAARVEKVPVILDGYVATAAAAVLHAVDREAIAHCLLGHVTTEPGHARAAEAIGLRPLFDLGLEEGEGVGAALAAVLVKNAAQIHAGMAVRE